MEYDLLRNSAFISPRSILYKAGLGGMLGKIEGFHMPSSILIVDDDEDISLMLKDRLMYLGFQVMTASHGAEGLAILEQMTVDGILLDIEMPIMDGLTMLDNVQEQYPKIPVIMMTAEQNQKKLIRAIDRGATDYLLKPIDIDLLAKKCETAFA